MEHLEQDILKVVGMGAHNIYLIAMSLQEDYDITETSKITYRLLARGWLKYNERYKIFVTEEGEKLLSGNGG
jgi:hypothetical protein